jgi:predicted permease
MLPLFTEARLAGRTLLRDRTFALTVLATFALCVAANVAIFAVVRAVLLRPLPFRSPEQLVVMINSYPKAGAMRAGSSVPHFLERRENLKTLAGLAAFQGRDAIVGEAGHPERVAALRVTSDFFTVLGTPTQLGRTFTAEDGQEGRDAVVILSNGFWRQEFAADPAIIGRTVRIDGVSRTIVGVMPATFRFDLAAESRLWFPLAFKPEDRAADRRHSNNLTVFGRLARGATVTQLQDEVNALNARMLDGDPFKQPVLDAGFHTDVYGLQADLTRNARNALWLLQGGALFVLLIGAVNLANLIFVRASARAKEMAIRRVLGAGPAAIARQVFLENILLAVVGGAIGVALGAALLPVLGPLGVAQLPRGTDARVDLTVAVAALGLAVLTGALLAVPPLVQHLGGKLAAALSVESRGGTTNRRQSRLREALIVAQIALAFVLLTGAGLLTLSFSRVLKVDPGFRPEQLLTAQVNLPSARFSKTEPRREYVQRLLREVAALPGIKSVAVSTAAPFAGQVDSNVFTVEGYEAPKGESLLAPFQTAVAGDFFGTYGFALRAGRFLNADDADAEPKLAVIDERFARKYWGDKSPMGRRIRQGTPDEKDAALFTVVGVVGSVKQADLTEPLNVGAVYLTYRQEASRGIILTVRTDMLPTALGPLLQAAALKVDPEVPLFDVKTMTERVDTSLGARRTPMVLAGAFAAGAVLLAVIGIYGVLAYTVAQRRREIGIRLALGALPTQVHAMFLRMGLRLLVVGLGIGIPLVWWLGSILRGQLFGIEPANPWVLTGGAAFVAAAAMVAAFVPARRAAATPAMEALRSD